MRLQVLGTAAGGGCPSGTARVLAAPGHALTRAAAGVTPQLAVRRTRALYVVNATPDIGDQIEASAGCGRDRGRASRR